MIQKYKSGDILKLDIEKLNTYGVGTVHQDELVFEVPFAYPGEKVEVELKWFFEKSNAWYGEITQILVPSPDRVFFEDTTITPGNIFNFWTYAKQIEWKQNHLNHFFPEAGEIMVSPGEREYRNHTTFHFFEKKDSKEIQAGVENRRTRSFYPINECPVSPTKLSRVKDSFIQLLREYKIPLKTERNRKGYLKGISLFTSFAEETILLTIIVSSVHRRDELLELVDQLKEIHPEISSIYLQEEKPDKRPQYYHFSGEKFLVDKFEKNGMKFRITPATLMYSNTLQAENLYHWIFERLSNLRKKKAVEFFSGSGILSLFMGRYCKMFYGFEMNGRGVQDAVYNSSLNNLGNTVFIQKRIEDFLNMPDLSEEDFDIIFWKSSLSDFSPHLIKIIERKNIQTVVITSSHLDILEKDIENLAKFGYVVKHFQAFDMYPQTHHIEMAVILENPNQKIKVQKKAASQKAPYKIKIKINSDK